MALYSKVERSILVFDLPNSGACSPSTFPTSYLWATDKDALNFEFSVYIYTFKSSFDPILQYLLDDRDYSESMDRFRNLLPVFQASSRSISPVSRHVALERRRGGTRHRPRGFFHFHVLCRPPTTRFPRLELLPLALYARVLRSTSVTAFRSASLEGLVRAPTPSHQPPFLFILKPSALGISGLIDFLPAFIPGFRPAYICPLLSLSRFLVLPPSFLGRLSTVGGGINLKRVQDFSFAIIRLNFRFALRWRLVSMVESISMNNLGWNGKCVCV